MSELLSRYEERPHQSQIPLQVGATGVNLGPPGTIGDKCIGMYELNKKIFLLKESGAFVYILVPDEKRPGGLIYKFVRVEMA